MVRQVMQPTALAHCTVAIAIACCVASAQGQCAFDVSTKIVALEDGAPDDKYGFAVDICGDVAVVGVPQSGLDDAGAVYVYTYNHGTSQWGNEVKLTASDADDGDNFGYSVAIDENVILVGAPARNGWFGGAYVFRYTGSQWVQDQQILEPSEGGTTPFFGCAVAIHKGATEDSAVVGGMWAERGGGALGSNGFAVVFRYGGSWAEEVITWHPDYGTTYSDYGTSVSIDGDLMIVGAREDADGGSAFAYRYQEPPPPGEPEWVLDEWFNYDTGNTKYGFSVAVSGDVAIIGGENSQSAYGYYYVDSVWRDETYLVAHDDQGTNEHFGYSVHVDNGSW